MASGQPPQEDKILEFIYEGKNFLDQDKLEEALDILQKACEYAPNHIGVRTLLALTYTRLERLNDAETLYKTLIKENPKESALLVDLARLYMKQNAHEEARRCLEDALSLQPNNRQAQTWLGLAYAKLGWYKEAYEQFKSAEQDKFAQKMLAKLEEAGGEVPADATSKPGSQGGMASVVVLPPTNDPHKDVKPSDVPFPVLRNAAKTPVPFSKKGLNQAQTQNQKQGSRTWLSLSSFETTETQPFVLFEDRRLLISITTRAYSRLQNIQIVAGQPDIVWESKRFQGKPLEQMFGPRKNPIAKIEGAGQVLLGIPPEHHRLLIELKEEVGAYFREGAILAFSGGIQWENGRVPSPFKHLDDLPLDNFWGDGALVLESNRKIMGLKVEPGQRTRIAFDQLLGWMGSLVPRIVESDWQFPEQSAQAFIEFEGTGRILLNC